MWFFLFAVPAWAEAPLTLTITDAEVTAVLLDCGPNKQLKARVEGGVASFAAVPSEPCRVVLVRNGGTIDSGGAWTCDLDNCTQLDVHHTPVSDANRRINVILPGLPPGASIEIQCPEGYRDRQQVIENTATFEGVPDDRCSMMVKGAVPARFSPISEGTWYCQLTGTTAVCHKKVQ